MNARRISLLTAAILMLLPAAAQSADKSKPAEAARTLPWLSSLAEAGRRAATDRKPMLIRVGASWCPPCRKLEAEIEKPSVQAELARWTLLYLDADKAEEEARDLNVTALPALRIRTMLGESVAAQDGLVSAEELVGWLKKQYEAAAAEADEVLLTDDEPDAAAVVRLVRQFQQRNPAIREAAIRRLAPYPQKARLDVVRAFVEGNLSRRLAALELLQQWRAPVAEFDPWQSQTLTKERIAALNSWAEKFQPPAAPPIKKVSAEALAEARRDIDRMLKANDGDAEAIRHRLAGYGAALLPEVTARLKETAADDQRQRLWALRYRLVAADSLALRWPGGLERLAATDPRRRQQAADELARLALAADQPLLVELFSDNDPLVREFSLRALQNIGGKETTAALLKLLSDPEPNVRAAVLKQLEEKPDASIVPKLADYLKTEKDADLLVHTIRFLRAAGGSPATRALIPLLHHESWQVRAEACEALGKVRENRYGQVSSSDDSAENLQVEVYVAMLDLLADADAFVVSRAVEGLSGADMAVAVDPLVRAAAKHPDLAPKIVEMLAQGQKMRVAALPHLRTFRKDANPQVRAAALSGLCTVLPSAMGDEISAGLQDPSEMVRIAAAQVCFQTMEAQRSSLVRKLQQESPGGESDDPFGQAPVAPAPSFFDSVVELFTGSEPKSKPATESTLVLESKAEEDPFPEGLEVNGDLKPAVKTKPVVEIKPAASPEPAPRIMTQDDMVKDLQAGVKTNSKAESKPVAATKTSQPPHGADDDPYELWLKEYASGKHRPQWAADLIGPLEKMLPSKNPDERLAAAITLAPLGKAQSVLPLIYDIARSDPKKYHEVMEVLPWLAWEQRLAAFRQLRKIAPTPEAVSSLVYAMARVHDPRAAELFWELLADAKTTEQQAGAIEEGLISVHGIQRWYSVGSRPQSAAVKKSLLELARSAKSRATSGSELQRQVAIGLLTYADTDEAIRIVEKLQADTTVGAALRRCAFQVMLVEAAPKEAAAAAAAALADKDPARQKLALQYFVHGPEALSTVRDTISIASRSTTVSIRSGQPIVPKPPAGLKVSQVLPLLDDSDPAVAAEAGYLLALMGESRGLEPLLRYAQQQGKSDSALQRLVYRAIAVLDDSNQVRVLRKIYAGLDQYEVSEFYWTIRIMTGPEILKFRKQIRDEVGMNQLQ